MNGYQYGDSGYDGNGMSQDGQQDMQNMMMMGGRAGMNTASSGDGGMTPSQSLDEIVNMNNMNNTSMNPKMIRRQSMPQGYANTTTNQGNSYNPGMRRINSMMEFNGSRSPAENMNFSYNSGIPMNQTGSISGGNTPTQGASVPIQSRRQNSNQLNLNTTFQNQQRNYPAMMTANSSYGSPANQSGLDIDITSPYIDPSLNMQMDFSLDQSGMANMAGMGGDMSGDMGGNMGTSMNGNISGNMGNSMAGSMGNNMVNMGNMTSNAAGAMSGNAPANLGGNMGQTMDDMQMPMYNQSQFGQNVAGSPIQTNTPQGTPGSLQRAVSHDANGRSGSGSQYGRKSQRPSMPHQLSRSHTAQAASSQSPQHASVTSTVNEVQSNQNMQPDRQQTSSSGFQGQPQNPLPGSLQDRGVGRVANEFDGINGPLPVKPTNYNPNNQNFPWEPAGGQWPSTMVNKPHMDSAYKNAYSSTGFDMLGVLVSTLADKFLML